MLSRGSGASSRPPGVLWGVSGAFWCVSVVLSALARVNSDLDPTAPLVAQALIRVKTFETLLSLAKPSCAARARLRVFSGLDPLAPVVARGLICAKPG